MKDIYKVIENKDWDIVEVEKNKALEISKYSPAGEDFVIYIEFDGTVKDLINKINERAKNFDVDEHVEMWIEAKNNGVRGVPSSIKTLLEDAEAIQEMLKELANAIGSNKR